MLQRFVPVGTEAYISRFLVEKQVHFTITQERKSKYGDYRHPFMGKTHQITVNGNLNKYAFLITTIHEMAHLTCWEKYRNTVQSHGGEWKNEFRILFKPVLDAEILPFDITLAVNNYLGNIKASSCSDDALYRVLRRYDKRPAVFVEHIEFGQKFKLNDRIFVKGKKLRKRYECILLETNEKYRVHGVAEVELIRDEEE
ncbi:MAG: sprT domain-containing protein [Crocinitomicaceae bacterium]|nr:sprT domain-containing protein [Crocinitomicaceae bacterium]MBK8926359.1 sprT domain-containing protein [Crocinitomicaceae bacterium]